MDLRCLEAATSSKNRMQSDNIALKWYLRSWDDATRPLCSLEKKREIESSNGFNWDVFLIRSNRKCAIKPLGEYINRVKLSRNRFMFDSLMRNINITAMCIWSQRITSGEFFPTICRLFFERANHMCGKIAHCRLHRCEMKTKLFSEIDFFARSPRLNKFSYFIDSYSDYNVEMFLVPIEFPDNTQQFGNFGLTCDDDYWQARARERECM